MRKGPGWGRGPHLVLPDVCAPGVGATGPRAEGVMSGRLQVPMLQMLCNTM